MLVRRGIFCGLGICAESGLIHWAAGLRGKPARQLTSVTNSLRKPVCNGLFKSFCLPYKRAGVGFVRFSRVSWPARYKSKSVSQCRQPLRRRISGVLSLHRCLSSWQVLHIRQEFSCWFYQVSVVTLNFSLSFKRRTLSSDRCDRRNSGCDAHPDGDESADYGCKSR